MNVFRLPVSLPVPVIALIGLIAGAPAVCHEGKAARHTAEEVSKQWGFSATTLKAGGKVSAGVQSNGEKLRWNQITVRLNDLSYAESFARVVRFYADRCGSDFAYNPEMMVVGHKGEGRRGRYIFSDVRPDPREVSFVFDAAEYTVSGLIRPAAEKGAVEVILTVAVR
jgi:hypothetical protein